MCNTSLEEEMKRCLFLKTTLLVMVTVLLATNAWASGPMLQNRYTTTWETSPLPEKSGPVTIFFEFSPVEKCLSADEFRVSPKAYRGLNYAGPEVIVIEGTGAKSYRAEIQVIVSAGDKCYVSIDIATKGCSGSPNVWFWPSDSGVQCGPNLPRPPKPQHPADINRAKFTEEGLKAEKYVEVPYAWLIMPSQREHLLRLLGPSDPPMEADSIYRNRATVDMILQLDKLNVGFRSQRYVTPPPPR
jgi:hypothetical protein